MRRWTSRVALTLLVAVGAGCAPTESNLFPLSAGTTWTYNVRTAFSASVEELKVTRKLAVGGLPGYELQSPMGQMRVAWNRHTLVAEQLAQARANPPLPILDISEKALAKPKPKSKDDFQEPRDEPPPFSRVWTGNLFHLGRSSPATATLTQEAAEVRAGAQTRPATLARLVVQSGARRIELLTWYVAGLGIARQEHRTNGRMDVRLEWVSGPKR